MGEGQLQEEQGKNPRRLHIPSQRKHFCAGKKQSADGAATWERGGSAVTSASHGSGLVPFLRAAASVQFINQRTESTAIGGEMLCKFLTPQQTAY